VLKEVWPGALLGVAGAAFSSLAFKAPRFFAYFFSNAKSKASPARTKLN